jgi:NADH-quinone oxidoreductase subunit M
MLTVLLVILPLFFSLIAFSLRQEKVIRLFTLLASLLVFGIAVAALVRFATNCHCELLYVANWSPSPGVSLKFGMDGLNIWMVMLTAFLLPLIILSTYNRNFSNPSAFYGLILLMESALIGIFTTFDGLVFYIFWELALIPAWFICALWGGEDRIRITFKFFSYTFTGSLMMLAGLIWFYLRTPVPHSFDFQHLYRAILTSQERHWIFAAFLIAFAIKIPAFPFHTWQPDTYTQSPAAGTMLLGGLMAKMGLYGVLRLLIPVSQGILEGWRDPVIIMAITGIVYASLIAITQDDLKRLVAYSSIAHASLILAGLMTVSMQTLKGGVFQMVAHGVNITGLFIMIDFMERRTGKRSIASFGGIAQKAPRFAILFMILLLGSIAFPLTNGFAGEFLLLLGLFAYDPIFGSIAALTVILSAVYMLWMYQRIFFGESNVGNGNITDLTVAEMITVVPLALTVVITGCFPNLILNLINLG